MKANVLDELFVKCDYYFDINHEAEIVSAVRRAFLHNHLIFAFKETAHNRDFVAEEYIYPSEEASRMIGDIQTAMADEAVLSEHLRRQKEAAFSENAEKYREI